MRWRGKGRSSTIWQRAQEQAGKVTRLAYAFELALKSCRIIILKIISVTGFIKPASSKEFPLPKEVF